MKYVLMVLLVACLMAGCCDTSTTEKNAGGLDSKIQQLEGRIDQLEKRVDEEHVGGMLPLN